MILGDLLNFTSGVGAICRSVTSIGFEYLFGICGSLPLFLVITAVTSACDHFAFSTGRGTVCFVALGGKRGFTIARAAVRVLTLKLGRGKRPFVAT